MNTTASEVDLANPISCVTTTIVMPSDPRSAINDRMPLTNSGSSAEVASSKNITCGDIASAGDRHPLLLPARQRAGPHIGLVPQPHPLQLLQSQLACLFGAEPLELARRQRH